MAGMVVQNITDDCTPSLSKAESRAYGHKGWYILKNSYELWLGCFQEQYS